MVVAITQKQESCIESSESTSRANGNESMNAESDEMTSKKTLLQLPLPMPSLPQPSPSSTPTLTPTTPDVNVIFQYELKPLDVRYLILGEPIRIGRVLKRSRISKNNLFFDCKVMSRNHALLWFENGKLFVKDLDSSNGTYVNDVRLNSLVPHEVLPDEVIKFGIHVADNESNHDCVAGSFKIVAAIDDPELSNHASARNVDVSIDQLSTLNIYLQEALQRENQLENKLKEIQENLQKAESTTDLHWDNFIKEDKLYSIIESLELKLRFYLRSFPSEDLKAEIENLQSEKDYLLTKSKEILMNLHMERMSLHAKCNQLQSEVTINENRIYDFQRAENDKEQQLSELVRVYETSKKTITDLRNSLNEQKNDQIRLKHEFESLKSNYEQDLVQLKNSLNSLVEKKEQVQRALREVQDQTMNDDLDDLKIISTHHLVDLLKNFRTSLQLFEQKIELGKRYLSSLCNEKSQDELINQFYHNTSNAVMRDDDQLQMNGFNSWDETHDSKAIEEMHTDCEQILEEISKIKKRVEILEDHVIGGKLKDTNEQLRHTLNCERQLNEHLQREIEELKEKLSQAASEHEQLVDGFDACENALRTQNRELELEAREKSERYATEIRHLESEIASSEEKLECVENRNSQLEMALEALQKKCNSSSIQFSWGSYFFNIFCLFVTCLLLQKFYFYNN